MDYHFSYRTKNGSVCLILSYKIGKKWRQKTRQGFKTQREARQHQDELLEEVRKLEGLTTDLTLQGITLRQFWALFARDKKRSLSWSTLRSYQQGLALFSSLLDTPVRELTTAAIVNAIQMPDRAPATLNLALAALKTVLEHARTVYKLISVNPARDVKSLKAKDKQPIRAFTRQEVEQLLAQLKPRPYSWLLCFLAVRTGMRRGEILGLTWDDVDWARGTLTVSKQWAKSPQGGFAFKTCKTRNSYRTIPASAAVLQTLARWRQEHPLSIDGRILGGASTYSLIDYTGNYIRVHYPGRSVHSLRHTFATLLLQETGDVNLVAAVLGDTVATVSNTYLDYTQDVRDRAADGIEAIF